jgi:hypothetical protein
VYKVNTFAFCRVISQFLMATLPTEFTLDLGNLVPTEGLLDQQIVAAEILLKKYQKRRKTERAKLLSEGKPP